MGQTSEFISRLGDKFQSFYERLTEFTQEAADLHAAMPVHDDASRAAYNSLSRVMAFTDQLNILVSLMREDVRVIEELRSAAIEPMWSEEIEQGFYELLRNSQKSAAMVH